MKKSYIFWKCICCDFILTWSQYMDAKFDNCPRCGEHLSKYKSFEFITVDGGQNEENLLWV